MTLDFWFQNLFAEYMEIKKKNCSKIYAEMVLQTSRFASCDDEIQNINWSLIVICKFDFYYNDEWCNDVLEDSWLNGFSRVDLF